MYDPDTLSRFHWVTEQVNKVMTKNIPSPTNVVFVYSACSSLVKTLLLFSPAAFSAAVSVCFTTPTL